MPRLWRYDLQSWSPANTRWPRLAVRRPIGKVSSGRTQPGRKMQSGVIGGEEGVHVKYRWFDCDLRRLRVCGRWNGRYVLARCGALHRRRPVGDLKRCIHRVLAQWHRDCATAMATAVAAAAGDDQCRTWTRAFRGARERANINVYTHYNRPMIACILRVLSTNACHARCVHLSHKFA